MNYGLNLSYKSIYSVQQSEWAQTTTIAYLNKSMRIDYDCTYTKSKSDQKHTFLLCSSSIGLHNRPYQGRVSKSTENEK